MPPFRPRSPRRHRGDTIFIEAGYASEAVGVTVENLIFDSASATSTGIVLNLGAGIAHVTLQGQAPIFVTGNGDANTIVGNSGNNTFNGGGGSDILNGGLGEDTFNHTLGEGVDAINSGTGNDGAGDLLNLLGTGGGDTVAAFFANGKIESLTDVTFANVERFALDLGGGASDTLSYASTTVDVTVNLRAGTGTGFISVLGVEHVTGGSGNDADGDAATHYQFWDDGAAGDNGYFWTPSNEHNPLGVLITISAASSLTLGCAAARCRAPRRCGVRAFDGTTWSAWDSFAVMTV